jgi:hypothetical protein
MRRGQVQGAGGGAASLQASAVLDFELEMVRCCLPYPMLCARARGSAAAHSCAVSHPVVLPGGGLRPNGGRAAR